MKRKTIEVHFRRFSDFENQLIKSASNRHKIPKQEHCIYFDSVEGFRRFMTIQKLELLTIISAGSPGSIYELAKITGREFPAVLKDCLALEAVGFIKIQQDKVGRKTKKPLLPFPYQTIAVYLPKNPYEISFRKAA